MFITFEGPEGSGKTSVANEIFKKLIAAGYQAIYTREPGGTPLSEDIRNILLKQGKYKTVIDARAEALLFAADRRQHLVEKIWPALKEGKIVLCDRHLDSSLAYQGGARGLGVENVLSINMFATEDTFPDLTLLFDINPEIGLARIAKNAGREVNRLDLEKLEFHKKVRQSFLDLSERYKDRYVVIDASKPLDEVIANTYGIIIKKLGKKL